MSLAGDETEFVERLRERLGQRPPHVHRWVNSVTCAGWSGFEVDGGYMDARIPPSAAVVATAFVCDRPGVDLAAQIESISFRYSPTWFVRDLAALSPLWPGPQKTCVFVPGPDLRDPTLDILARIMFTAYHNYHRRKDQDYLVELDARADRGEDITREARLARVEEWYFQLTIYTLWWT